MMQSIVLRIGAGLGLDELCGMEDLLTDMGILIDWDDIECENESLIVGAVVDDTKVSDYGALKEALLKDFGSDVEADDDRTADRVVRRMKEELA